MAQFFAFTGRNLKVYFRDKGAVFSSLLSMLIVIVLMVFFLGDMSIENTTQLLGQFPGRDASADKENARLLVYAWTCAGIISINAVTVTTAVYSSMVKDRVSQKLNSIYTAPLNRGIITAGYVATAWIAAMAICVFTLALTEVYGVFQGMEVYSVAEHLRILGLICMNSFLYAAIMYLPAALTNSDGAWSGIATVIGTLVGFLGGIYIPVGSFSGTIQGILKCTPILYGTVLFRDILCDGILGKTFAGVSGTVMAEYREVMGIDVTVFGHRMGMGKILGLLLLVGLLFMILDICALKFGKKSDR